MTVNPGRPARDESIDYYFKYIDLVPDGDIRDVLEAQQHETRSFLQGIPEERRGFRYADGKWTVSDVVAHVNDCERLFAMRAFWFGRGMEAVLPSYEPEVAVTAAKAIERPWSSLVEEFASLRASTVLLFRYFPAEAWNRRGVASGYPFSVRALAYIAAGHVIHHSASLRERYL